MKDLPFIAELVSVFEKLPGVGHKTATRYAYYVIEKYNIEDIEKVSDVLKNTMSHIHKCHECGMFTTGELCDICSDTSRDHQKVLVVKDYKDLISIEKTGQYNGVYHCLGGLISAFDGISPDELNLEILEQKCASGKVNEVIIALSLSPAGDITASFIEKILSKYPNLTVSRIGYGLPAGSDLEYADELTIKRALEYRIINRK